MDIGTQLPAYSTGERRLAPDTIRDWARGAEAAGFTDLWAIDHLVKPHTYSTAVLDPIVSLSHAAAVTEEIRLGTGVLILPLRRTAPAAKRILTLQHLADRPVTLGVGAGYNHLEFEVAGVPRSERGPRLSEGVEVLKELLEPGAASFGGRFHSFEDIDVDPEPSAPIEILSGGGSKSEDGERHIIDPILRRILAVDGWVAQPTQPPKLREEIGIIDDYARDQGVDTDEIQKAVVTYSHLVKGNDVNAEQQRAFTDLFGSDGYGRAKEHLLVGSIDEIIDQLQAYSDIGVDKVIVGPPSTRAEDYECQLELFTKEILPSFT
jgi:alkanesulfonate monooxygenase SsuD/methylene tetrahydromethanopterin reductase-like flavin-dependent oxidoreductase (luciferase family)